MEIAMGRFLGAKKTPAAIALQFKFMDALKAHATPDELRLFIYQLRDIDHRCHAEDERYLPEKAWGDCLKEGHQATVAEFDDLLRQVQLP